MDTWLQTLLPVPLVPRFWLGVLLFSAILLAGLLADLGLALWCVRRPPDWVSAGRRLRETPWTPRHGMVVLLIVAGFYGARFLLGLFAQPAPPPEITRIPAVPFLLDILSFPAVSVAVTLFMMRRLKAGWKTAFGIERRALPRHLLQAGVAYLVMMPILAFLSFLYVLFLVSRGYPVERQEVLQWFMNPAFPLWAKGAIIALALVVAPVVEELLFRGIAIPAFTKSAGPAASILLTSLLFAVIHMHIPSLVPLVVVALTLALAYAFSGSLTVPIVLHAVFNTVNLIGAFLFRDPPGFTGGW